MTAAAGPRVVATVLTRNRRDLLRECLTALAEQTRPPDLVVVVDNDSDDGTPEMLAGEFPAVHLVALHENLGATGGFYEAIRAGVEQGGDWLWLMDDDSIARPTALQELLAALDRIDGAERPALLASRVEWRDGAPHPMNRPSVRRRDPDEMVRALRRGLLPIRATTWVSLLLSRAAVERSGMPLKHFFYQADDIEYTARVLRHARGYYVSDSVVEHRTATQHTAVDDDHRFFYHARNTVLMLRGSAWGPREKPVLVWWLLATSIIYLRINRLRPGAVRTLVSGVLAGFRVPAV